MNALIVVGSPKGRAAASLAPGAGLPGALREHGVTACDGSAHHALLSAGETASRLDACNAAAIPEEAAALFARPPVPRRMGTSIGDLGWRMRMRKRKARRPMGFRPFEKEQAAGSPVPEDPCSDASCFSS